MISTARWNGCFIIPTYNNPLTIRAVVEQARTFGLPIIVVDDGSDDPGRIACETVAEEGLAILTRHPHNRGKGAAIKTGFGLARERGFTHALQVDGDAQHDLTYAPVFLQTSREQPAAVILGYPIYDKSAPRVRVVARKLTTFWVNLEAGIGRIRDAMIGFRVYPIEAVSSLPVAADRMDYDIEVAVRAVWANLPVINLPVRLRYLDASEGGISHFKVWRDNFSFFRLHSRLCTRRCMSWVLPKQRMLDSRGR